MSITSRVNMKKFQEIDLPALQKGVDYVIGKELDWQVDILSFDFVKDETSFFEKDNVTTEFDLYVFGPLRKVLGEFCENPEVKDMITESLKGIKLLANHPDGIKYGTIDFEEGYLVIKSMIGHNFAGIEDIIADMMRKVIDQSL